MAALIYLSIVDVPQCASKAMIFSRVVNPSAPRQADRIQDTLYLTESSAGYTRIKLKELCRVIEKLALPPKSKIMVYPDDRLIARLGKRFGIEEGDQEPTKNRDLWNRLSEEVSKNNYDIMFEFQGLMSDSIRDTLLCEREKVRPNE